MSSYKFVICVTGSIAAYKACDLVSLLRKQGHQTKVIMSSAAEKFVGAATLQSLSGHRVYRDDFAEDSLMAHIELGKWCDAALIYPASANTINSFSSGVGSELHHSFFLAYDFNKPLFIAPAMNTRMLKHPSTQKSIQFLSQMGCQFIPTAEGDLACGENGDGRLLPPIETSERLFQALGKPKDQIKRILITAGGTRETIDGVRTLTNMSTGHTGAMLADSLHDQGYQVLLLTSRFAVMPKSDVKVDTYESFQEIYNTLKALGQTHDFDMILHAAAISDYSIQGIATPDGELSPGQEKMSSQYDNISIKLKRNEKILPRLKDLFDPKTTVIGFKLTSTESKEEQAKAIFSLFTENAVDYVVHNDMNDINRGQRRYLMTSKEGHQEDLASTQELATSIANLLKPRSSEEVYDLMS